MALLAIRRTSRRSASPDRIAAVVSVWRRAFWVTGSGTSGGDSIEPPPGLVAKCDLALLRAGGLLALGFLALALHARLLVMLAAACLGEDPALLDLLVESAERALEGLVLTHSDFCQSRFTSRGLVSSVRSQLVGRSA